jgi:hypothetical protein
MYAPVLKKLIDKSDTFIERSLPVPGNLFVKENDPVKPFDRLGECVFSQKQTSYPKNLKPAKYKNNGQFYYLGSNLGQLKRKAISAPYNGRLNKSGDGSFIFQAADDKYILLSGVWGTVHQAVENRAVLIKTRTSDLLLAASTEINTSGELVVFPNPMEILEKYYLESFSKNNEGKIVYVGHFADLEVVKRAAEMGASAVLAGSAHRDTFNYARSKGLGFGIISGFGKLETPEQVFKLLSVIAYRYVFLYGEKNILRIPHSLDGGQDVIEDKQPKKLKKATKTTKSTKAAKTAKIEKLVSQEKPEVIKEVVPGVDIVCLQAPNFGKIGTVDSVSESSIFVKFNTEKGSTEIKLPNFFIIE